MLLNPNRVKPVVIGLRGLAGAGKTTLSDALVQSLTTAHPSLGVERRSFAGPIREALAHIGVTKADNPRLYRKLAQTLGEECRKADPDHWIKQMAHQLDLEGNVAPDVIVIDDVRYPNEAAFCTYLFFIEPTFPPADLGDRAGHESEVWNLIREGPMDVIKNVYNQPMQAIQEIMESLSDEVLNGDRD